MKTKLERFIRIFGAFACSLFIAAVSVYIYSPVSKSDASSDTITENSGPYTLSLTTNSDVKIDVTPTNDQAVYSASNNLQFTSDCPSGATVAMNMASDSDVLTGTVSSIAATEHSPLDDNSWGFSLDGETWQRVPIASSTPTVVYTATESITQTIPVLFGIKIDNSLPSGSYINDIVYTLIPDAGCYTFAVAWDSNSGINPEDLPDAVDLDGPIDLSALPKPTRDYYDFAGWTNGITDFTGDETDAIINPDNSPNIIMRALWRPITYPIEYDLVGGTVSIANPTSYDVESDPIVLNNPTKTNYSFSGWSGTDLSDPSTTVSIETGSHGERNYTANWTPVNYTISYNLNGGSVSPANPTSYNVESANFTLRNPTRSGYTFTGWSGTGISGTSTSVTVTKGSTGNRSYTANWVATCTFTSKDFSYTGGVQSWTVPCDATYKLEVYGAQGGNSAAFANSYVGRGGAGGYATGNVSLRTGTVLYIVIGGQGGTSPTSGVSQSTGLYGGYNGGGTIANYVGEDDYLAGGGGCTHIGKTNALTQNTAAGNLYIVAGGGGGGHLNTTVFYEPHVGGTGGGTATGVNGGSSNGYAWSSGSNGAGGAGYRGSAGGCGWPGGAGAAYAAGGGGAGYIGGVSGGSMSNGQRSGNGYAKITKV